MKSRSVFDRIYREDLWTNGSGPGSSDVSTRHVGPALVGLVDALGVTSVLDVGCGDGQWMPDLPGYLGVDVSGEAVRRSRARHPSRRFMLDAGLVSLPRAGLVIVRDVVQHLAPEAGMVLVARAWEAADPWLLMSHYVGGRTEAIETGVYAYSPDMTAEPFGLPQPMAAVFDGWGWHEPPHVRDARKVLGLWRTG